MALSFIQELFGVGRAPELFENPKKRPLRRTPGRGKAGAGMKINYAEAKRVVSKYHKFSFKARSNFTGSQKAAITRAVNKYGGFIRDERKGVDVRAISYAVMPVKGGTSSPLAKRFPVSNKGLIILAPSGGVGIPDEQSRIRIYARLIRYKVGREKTGDITVEGEKVSMEGINLKRPIVVYKKKSGTSVFFPLLKGETAPELANLIIKIFSPHSINLTVKKNLGTTPYDPKAWDEYASVVMGIDKKLKDTQIERGEVVASPFTGIQASWYVKFNVGRTYYGKK